MDALVSKAAMILLSLHPGPASETSAFKRMRAFSSRRVDSFNGPGVHCWYASTRCAVTRTVRAHHCAITRRALAELDAHSGYAAGLSVAPRPRIVGKERSHQYPKIAIPVIRAAIQTAVQII